MGLYNQLAFTEALEQVEALTSATNPDEIADRIERVANHPDLVMAMMMLFVFKVRGVDTSQMNGVELAGTLPTIADLVLPPGFERR